MAKYHTLFTVKFSFIFQFWVKKFNNFCTLLTRLSYSKKEDYENVNVEEQNDEVQNEVSSRTVK